MRKVSALLFGLLLLWAAAVAKAQEYGYTVKELPPGFQSSDASSEALAINNKGEVVGTSYVIVDNVWISCGTRWGPAPQLLPNPMYGYNSQAFGINEEGLVVGWMGNDEVKEAVKWASGETAENLLPRSVSPTSIAYATNDLGNIVGYIYSAGDRPYMFKPVVASLGQKDDFGIARAIASAPEAPAIIVGTIQAAEFQYNDRAAILYEGDRKVLGNLPGGSSGVASGVNSYVNVVGYATDSQWHKHAVIWYQGGGNPVEMGSLGGLNSGAFAINNKNEVVGYAQPNPYETHAFYWKPGQKMKNLNNEIYNKNWTLLAATGINDKGQIVGYGYYGPDRKTRGFLLDPISQISRNAVDAVVNYIMSLPDQPRRDE